MPSFPLSCSQQAAEIRFYAAKRTRTVISAVRTQLRSTRPAESSVEPQPLSLTRNSLIVSAEALKGYYIFLLVERDPDHLLAKPRCPMAAEAMSGRRSLSLPFPNGSLDGYCLTYEYSKYVIDPMFHHQ